MVTVDAERGYGDEEIRASERRRNKVNPFPSFHFEKLRSFDSFGAGDFSDMRVWNVLRSVKVYIFMNVHDRACRSLSGESFSP